MRKIALTDRMLVDKHGSEYRLRSEMRQLGLTYKDLGVFKPSDKTKAPEGFTDRGVVWWDGEEYYMSEYSRPEPLADYDDYGD